MPGQFDQRVRLKARFTAYDCHCEGDVETVVTSGLPDLPAGPVFRKMKYLRRHHDDIRRFFLHEPRGSVVRSVNFIVASEHPEAVAGYIIAESEEYPAMSGGNTVSVATVLLKTGMVPITEPVTRFTLEAPAGLIGIECDTADGRIGAVRLVNRPAFVYCLDRVIELPGLAALPVDVAFGGMTYVLVDAAHFGFELVPSEGRTLCEVGQAVKRAAAEQIPVSHPEKSGDRRHNADPLPDSGRACAKRPPLQERRGRLTRSNRPLSVRYGNIGTACRAACARADFRWRAVPAPLPDRLRLLFGNHGARQGRAPRGRGDRHERPGVDHPRLATTSSRPTIPFRPATGSATRGRWMETIPE